MKTKTRSKSASNAGGNTVGRRARLDRTELESVLGFCLREAWSSMERHFLDCFRDEKITPATYAILVLVAANPDCLASDICAATSINTANIIPYIDDLVSRGLIRRQVAATDRRLKHLRLTPKGTERLAVWRDIEARQMAEYQRKLGAPNVRKLIELLTRLAVKDPQE